MISQEFRLCLGWRIGFRYSVALLMSMCKRSRVGIARANMVRIAFELRHYGTCLNESSK